MKPGKHQRSKQRCQDLGWKVPDRAQSFVLALYIMHELRKFLLVSSSVQSKQLFFFVHGQGQKSEQKPTTKNFVGFHNNSALLTMIERPKMFRKKNPRLHTERTLVKMMKPFAVGLQKSFQIFGIRNFRYQYGTLYFCFKNLFY